MLLPCGANLKIGLSTRLWQLDKECHFSTMGLFTFLQSIKL
ncbi:hypothetical protein RchiOBHm_Chr4g0419831 [Rosa chinensis]|uniref:Uncharacterized protein n=1 Tax=Rosa chinensis TaxID=74649 RepID=A0A2P6QXP1_ROSCH|nr:hypothetical protein RchiOBHm_Chr4g0419831 [Rosa chinensis]